MDSKLLIYVYVKKSLSSEHPVPLIFEMMGLPRSQHHAHPSAYQWLIIIKTINEAIKFGCRRLPGCPSNNRAPVSGIVGVFLRQIMQNVSTVSLIQEHDTANWEHIKVNHAHILGYCTIYWHSLLHCEGLRTFLYKQVRKNDHIVSKSACFY